MFDGVRAPATAYDKVYVASLTVKPPFPTIVGLLSFNASLPVTFLGLNGRECHPPALPLRIL